MLWDLVYEFFVKYIFGGIVDGEPYVAKIGTIFAFDNGAYDDTFDEFTNGIYAFSFPSLNDPNYVYHMSLGNYLSLIATIISMVAIVLICCLLIKKIYNMCAHIIG